MNGNIVALATPVTATAGTPVYFGDDAAPDRGAFPYKPTFNITTALSYAGGAITATVNDPSIVRHVEFYVDGLPVAVRYEPPYTLGTSAYARGVPYTVTAVARPLYASRTLSYEDTKTFNFSASPPAPPSQLRVTQ